MTLFFIITSTREYYVSYVLRLVNFSNKILLILTMYEIRRNNDYNKDRRNIDSWQDENFKITMII